MKRKKYSIYLINIFLVVLILLFFLIQKKMLIFGNNNLVISDGIFQFKPMIYSFISSIKYKVLQPFSFNNGLGNPTLFNYLYYLASPINLLALFLKKPDDMYCLILFVKIIISVITMTMYASWKTDKYYVNTIAVLSYVFSSWFLAFYFYLPWLDAFMMFPLLQLGLEYLIENKGSKIYIFSLAYIIATNFYIAFSVCIYIVLYLIIYSIYRGYNKREKKDIAKRFLKATFWTCLLDSFFLFAFADSFFRMGAYFDPLNNQYSTSIELIIKSLIPGIYDVTTTHFGKVFPNLSTTFVILIYNIYALFSNNINKKDKIMIILISCILLVFILSSHLNYILNVFHNVRGLPYRYSFILIFLQIKLFLYIANKNMRVEKGKNIIIILCLLILICLLKDKLDMDKTYVIISITVLMTLLIWFIFLNSNKMYKYLLVLITMMGIIFVLDNNINFKIPKENINIKYNRIDNKYRNNMEDIEDWEYYLNNYNEKNNNIGLYTNTKLINLHTSMTYNNVTVLLKRLGDVVINNSVIYHNDYNILVNMLFNVDNNFYYLEKIYVVNKDIKDVKLTLDNPRLNQEQIVEGMTGIKDIYDKEIIKGKLEEDYYHYIIKNPCYFYDYVDDKGMDNSEVSNIVNVLLKAKNNNSDLKIYYFKENKFNGIYNYLKKNQIKYTKYSDSYIEGDINVGENQLIFTSIPYDTNWIVYVDGKRVKAVKLLDSLMGIETGEGKHHIVLKYRNYNLIIPALVSFGMFVLLVQEKLRKR